MYLIEFPFRTKYELNVFSYLGKFSKLKKKGDEGWGADEEF